VPSQYVRAAASRAETSVHVIVSSGMCR
jgi:hypothetical protein